jgi:hypothetical protein
VPSGVLAWKQGGQARDSLSILRNVDGRQERLADGPFVEDVRVAW